MSPREAQFLKVITDKFGVIETREAMPMDALVLRDLKPDSLDFMEVAMLLEEEFGVELSDDAFEELGEGATLREILALVESKMEKVGG